MAQLIPDLQSLIRPYIFLILGVFALSVGAVSTYTGETWARYGRVYYRAKQPKEFWENVVGSYLIGCFIGYFLYRVT
jgi:hypothetical protein